MTSEKKETKKFLVPVSWTISAMVEIEAEDAVEANDFAFGMDLDTIEGADYVPNSFDVDFGMIEEVPTPEDTQAAVEDYVFWREAIEGVK